MGNILQSKNLYNCGLIIYIYAEKTIPFLWRVYDFDLNMHTYIDNRKFHEKNSICGVGL